jgi:hypothetical protein
MKKWKTGFYTDGLIEVVEVIRETPKGVVLEGVYRERHKKTMSGWEQFHDSFESARKYLLDEAKADLKRAENDLSRCLSRLAKIESLTEE